MSDPGYSEFPEPEKTIEPLTQEQIEAGIAALGSNDDRSSAEVVLDIWIAMNKTNARKTAVLRATLEGHAVALMGPRSPFWRCSFCEAMHTSPIQFKHKPDCILFVDSAP